MIHFTRNPESWIFPLFNIEFISLLKKEQKEGVRINDPNNPDAAISAEKV